MFSLLTKDDPNQKQQVPRRRKKRTKIKTHKVRLSGNNVEVSMHLAHCNIPIGKKKCYSALDKIFSDIFVLNIQHVAVTFSFDTGRWCGWYTFDLTKVVIIE